MHQTTYRVLGRHLAGPLLALAALASGGCDSDKITLPIVQNQPPTVRLTHAPLDSTSENFYAYRMNWVGYDPDGRVDYYVYKVDPALPVTVDATWTRTEKHEETIFFSTVDSTRVLSDNSWRTTQFHRFAIAAVDNDRQASAPAFRSFYSYTVAPTVQVVEPRPGSNFTPTVTPSVRITWTGEDPDGVFTTKPVRYKFRLFTQKNPDRPDLLEFIDWATTYPDSLRAFYAPDFPGWQESVAESTTASYTNLTPGELHLFVVTAYDEAGAYAPDFSVQQNMLLFEVGYGGTLGPKITIFNEFFNFTYKSGGYSKDPSRWINIEVPADLAITFNWGADPPPGATIRAYRWALSGPPPCDFDPDDETPRTNEERDLCHWTRYSLNTTSATLPPFGVNGETWFLYVEAADNAGLRSLGIVRFVVVRPTFERELLFVDDARLSPDRLLPGNVLEAPRGQWPSAAELDTFLFAVGGVPWRLYPPASGGGVQLTTPGVFAGYSFDTVGTRGIPSGVLPLSVLGRYRHVVWYTDDIGATFSQSGLHPVSPTTSLRKLTTPGNPSTLATWVKQGGRAWVMGGGAAFASLIEWNKNGTNNNEYTDTDLELVPGRFMYDFAHWRSEIRMLPGNAAIRHDPAANPAFVFTDPGTAPGRGWTGQPSYTRLPLQLQRRRLGTPDPVPPQRTANNFYVDQTNMEYLHRANFIREDADGDAETPGEISRLDTLYFTNVLGLPKPVMTLYHGREILGSTTHPFVFSGFPLWFFKRAQILPVADWVLQDLWHLSRTEVPRAPGAAAARAQPVPRPLATRTRP